MDEAMNDEAIAMLRLLTSACTLLALDASRNNRWLRSGVDWQNFECHLKDLDYVRQHNRPEDRGLENG